MTEKLRVRIYGFRLTKAERFSVVFSVMKKNRPNHYKPRVLRTHATCGQLQKKRPADAGR